MPNAARIAAARIAAAVLAALALAGAAVLGVRVRIDAVRPPAESARFQRTPDGEPLFYTADAFYHLRMSRELAETGHRGDREVDGRPWDDHSFAPAGRRVVASLLQELQLWAWRLWPGEASLTTVAYYLPAALAALSVVLGFWIGRRLAGAGGGLAAALLTAVHPELISHTHAGMSDTPALAVVLWALAAGAGLALAVALWRALTHDGDDRDGGRDDDRDGDPDGAEAPGEAGSGSGGARRRIPAAARAVAGWAVLLIAALAAFATTWAGWPAAALTAAAPVGAVLIAAAWRRAGTPRRRAVVVAGALVAAAAVGALLLSSRAGHRLVRYLDPHSFGIFPDAASQVQELDRLTPAALAGQLGGWPAVALIVLGLLWLVARAPRPAGPLGAVLLAAWALPAIALGARALRFMVYGVPAVTLIVGCAVAALARLVPLPGERSGRSETGKVARAAGWAALAVAGALIVASAYRQRIESFATRRPEADLSLAEAAAAIRERSPADALVYSWWDHGHPLAALAERPVVIDGASFQTRRLYWLALALTTPDETLAVHLLRVIGCGGEDRLLRELTARPMPPAKAVDLIRQALSRAGPEAAARSLRAGGAPDAAVETARELLSCEPPPSWLVVPGDLAAKTTSWSWFGNWRFGEPNPAPQPQISSPVPCRLSGGRKSEGRMVAGRLECTNGYSADLATAGFFDRSSPGHFAAVGPPRPDGLVPLLHQRQELLGLTFVRRELVDSLFVRLFFLQGLGLERFRLEGVFDHGLGTGRVLLYRVLWRVDEPAPEPREI